VEAAAGSKRAARVVVGEAASGGSYVRPVGGDTVFQTSRSLRHLFPSDTTKWLKLKLFDAELDEVQRVEVMLAGQSAWAIVPGDDEQGQEWKLEDASPLPEGFRFDGRGARSLATTLAGLRAKEIVGDPPDEDALGFSGKYDRLSLSTASGSVSVHLGATAEEDDVYARVAGRDAVFLIRSYQAKNLRKQLTDLRDLRLMAFDAESANGLAINHGRKEYRFIKSEAGWQIDPEGNQPDDDFEFDPNTVDRTVQSIASLRATTLEEGVSPAAAGLNRPTAKVEVVLVDGEPISLTFGKSTTDEDERTQYYAAGNADDRVYTVGEYHFTRLTRGWDTFKYVAPPPAAGNPFANMDPETLKNLPPEVRENIMRQMAEEQRKQELLRQIQAQQGSQ